MAFVLGLGLIIGMSSFKAISGKRVQQLYHIVADLGDRYQVSTEGTCDVEPIAPCSFMSEEEPDEEGIILKSALEAENPDYELDIVDGTYVPAP